MLDVKWCWGNVF